MILEQIRQANIDAMKNKDADMKSLYSVLLNKFMLADIEARTSGKPVTDDDRVRIIQKTILEINEEIENYKKVGSHEQEVEAKTRQKHELEKYLPKMLTREEIHDILVALPDHSIPFVMKHMKATYGNTCDMRLVQEVLKSL